MATIKSPQMINAGEERREHTYTVSGNVNCCSHYSKQYGASSKKTKNKITQRSRNQTYLDKTLIQKDTCILIFITALFAAAKPWKLSKCLQTTYAGEGVEKREPSSTVGGNVN